MKTTLEEMPLFRDYSLNEIRQRTGYSLVHLIAVMQGRVPLSPVFKEKVAASFRQSEERLFGGEPLS